MWTGRLTLLCFTGYRALSNNYFIGSSPQLSKADAPRGSTAHLSRSGSLPGGEKVGMEAGTEVQVQALTTGHSVTLGRLLHSASVCLHHKARTRDDTTHLPGLLQGLVNTLNQLKN